MVGCGVLAYVLFGVRGILDAPSWAAFVTELIWAMFLNTTKIMNIIKLVLENVLGAIKFTNIIK